MPNGTATAGDKNYWRGQADAHFADLKEGQEKIHNCLKKHIEQTEERLNGLEQKTAVHSTKIKIHWLLILVVLASVLGLGVRAAFGMVEPDRDTVQFYKDGSIRYDYSFNLIGQDTASFGPFRVKDYRSFGFYMRAEGTDSIHLGAICLQSDIQDSVFARVDGYSVIDTSFTDSAIARWYPVYPTGLTYITYYVYGNAGNDGSDSCSVRVRLVFGKWKGTMRTIPGTGVYVHHHAEVVGDQDIHGFVNFYADSIEQGRPALVYGYNSNFAYLYPDPGRGFPGSQIYFSLGTSDYRVDTSWTSIANVVQLRFTPSVKIELRAGKFKFYSADVVPFLTNNLDMGVSSLRWRQVHGRSVHCDSLLTNRIRVTSGLPSSFDTTLNLTVAASGTDCPALSIPNADVGMTIKPGAWPFNVAGYLATGLFFTAGGAAVYKGYGDIFFGVELLGANKGDVNFFDNAATPVRHMWWDASKQKFFFNSNDGSWLDVSGDGQLLIYGGDALYLSTGAPSNPIIFTGRLRPYSNHASSIGSGTCAVDTVYAADFNVTSSMFSGTGAEALSILETIQALPGDRLDHEAIDPYLTPSSPNAVSLNRWIALLTVAVQDLGKKNIELAQRIEELSR